MRANLVPRTVRAIGAGVERYSKTRFAGYRTRERRIDEVGRALALLPLFRQRVVFGYRYDDKDRQPAALYDETFAVIHRTAHDLAEVLLHVRRRDNGGGTFVVVW